VAKRCDTVKHVVAIGDSAVEGDHSGASFALHPVQKLKDTAELVAEEKPSKDDIAVIMYTSGTTGMPKGVVISHANIVSLAAGTLTKGAVLMENPAVYALTPDETYLAYLPLAHIMELATEVALYYHGCLIGYGTPQTLTPTSPKMKQTKPPQVGDAAALRPTAMVFAPAVLDRVYATIKSRVEGGSTLKQTLFAWAMADGVARYDKGLIGASWHYDLLVFSKIQALLGGRVRLMLTGSAPLAADVQKFVQTCFRAPCRQGYGLTETCAATCITAMGDNATGVVGPPQESACIRLRDWDEGNYRNADKADPAIGMPRGEVLIGGPAVCQGYWVPEGGDAELEAKNASEFVVLDGVRYFCTGDIGQITKEGNLMIIDRKKDLVKLQMGEYVALSKVENVLKNSSFVQIPMVYAESTKSYCIVLVCPQPPALQALGESLGLGKKDLPTLCADAKVIKAVADDLKKVCKAAKLATFEIPTKVVLVDDEWSVDNDMLTSTMKVKRKPIADKHKGQIQAVYT